MAYFNLHWFDLEIHPASHVNKSVCLLTGSKQRPRPFSSTGDGGGKVCPSWNRNQVNPSPCLIKFLSLPFSLSSLPPPLSLSLLPSLCLPSSFQAPAWAFILSALGLFIYQSLDAIDGKQARRTNSSSALGELFDHGCDAVSTGAGQIIFVVACFNLWCFTVPDQVYFKQWGSPVLLSRVWTRLNLVF